MSLYQTLLDARGEARKAHEEAKLGILQVALAALKNEAIQKMKQELSDEEVQQILTRQVKQLQDARVDFERAGRSDLLEKTDQEVKLLQAFLPAQMSDEELEAAVKTLVLELTPSGPCDIGRVMGAVMAHLKGKADGARVRALVTKMVAQ